MRLRRTLRLVQQLPRLCGPVLSMAFSGSGEHIQPGKCHRPDVPLYMSEPLSRYTLTRPLADTIISAVTVTAPHPTQPRPLPDAVDHRGSNRTLDGCAEPEVSLSTCHLTL